MNILINLLGIAIIAFVYWFFFGKKKEEVTMVENNRVVIKVAGGYQPNHLVLKKGEPTTLVFHRTDQSDCLEEVVIPDFGVREHLPIGQDHEVTFTPEKEGVFTMSCGMNMFHGKLEVRS